VESHRSSPLVVRGRRTDHDCPTIESQPQEQSGFLRSPLIASATPSGPGTEETCSGRGSHSPDGDDLGEATYAQIIRSGDEIHLGAGQRFRVLDLVPFDEEDESPFIGMLKVEAA
jgi:hypothetical protein